jgi:hypothetical protein
MKKYGCCHVHHCPNEKKNLSKMVNVYGLSLSVRKEEIHYPNLPFPTTTTTIVTTIVVDIFGLSSYCKEKPQENRNKNKKVKKCKRTFFFKKKGKKKNQKQKEE